MKTVVTTAMSLALLASAALAQFTQRVSLRSSGAEGNGDSFVCRISSNGRYVAFESVASTLVAGDTNGVSDLFVRDRRTATTERVSIGGGGTEGDSASFDPALSPDARYVAFFSDATNFVAGDTNGQLDVFLRDRQTGTTERVSVDSSGAEGNSGSFEAAMSADGRFVAFRSFATNLVPGDTNGNADIFVRDRQSGTTERVSVDTAGVQGNSFSFGTAISANGRYVAFTSFASNLVAGDTNNRYDIFVRDRLAATTERVSVATGGAQANNDSTYPTISGDGRYVLFSSLATNYVAGDGNGAQDVYLRDRIAGTTERVSVDSAENGGNAQSSALGISADGGYVAFQSRATNLVVGDVNNFGDVFVRDRVAGTTERVNVGPGGVQANHESSAGSISADGAHVVFGSAASNLVPADGNGFGDVFVHEHGGGPDFTSMCHPRVGGVIACPCANPPVAVGRGCDNSSSTGGAVLGAAGASSLSSDSVVFTTSGEKPAALSVVVQWTGANASGVVFGMGVRCTSGVVRRLYTKNASLGSITAPSFGGGEPQVSVRSAALGDPISAGQSRWYLVYYRDPFVLGGCPYTATFNATQTGVVTWSP